MNPYTHEKIENWVGDFCASDAVTRIPAAHRDDAAPVLVAFLTAACDHRDQEPDALEEEDVRQALLGDVARLALDKERLASVPSWCAELLRYLEESGRLGGGRALGSFARALRGAFLEAAGHGEPIVRPGSRIGRNDPCPCGSGKKYKKCCLRAGG